MGDPRKHLDPKRAPGRSPSRLAGYHRLLEACRQPGCPVCRCLRELTGRHLQTLISEHATDPVTRARLARSSGFCAAHAARLRELREVALGVGIVYEALLGQTRRWLADAQRALPTPSTGRGWRRLLNRPSPARAAAAPPDRHRRCPACLVLADAERDCLPHLGIALLQGPEQRGVGLLLARTLEKIDRLSAELRTFIDKHDHRARSAFTAGEAAAWSAALGFVAGPPDLFGPEIPRPGLVPRPSPTR